MQNTTIHSSNSSTVSTSAVNITTVKLLATLQKIPFNGALQLIVLGGLIFIALLIVHKLLQAQSCIRTMKKKLKRKSSERKKNKLKLESSTTELLSLRDDPEAGEKTKALMFLDGRDFNSKLLKNETFERLCRCLPVHFQWFQWKLSYKSYEDGVSVRTVFEKCKNKPTVFLFQEASTQNTLGMFVPEVRSRVHKPSNYYRLFRIEEKSHMLESWISDSEVFITFICSTINSRLAIMSQKKICFGALSDLRHCTAEASETFGSPQLGPQKDWKSTRVEAWTLQTPE